jgi:uncharacterized membrane protein
MDTSYLWMKALHLFGVIMFLGNLVISSWWKIMAARTRNPVIITFAQHQATFADRLFAGGGLLLMLIGGPGNVMQHHLDFLHIFWLKWGFWLFVAVGMIWGAILVPLQIAQSRMARQFAAGGKIPARYWKLERLWQAFSLLATLLVLMSIYWMVFKPTY